MWVRMRGLGSEERGAGVMVGCWDWGRGWRGVGEGRAEDECRLEARRLDARLGHRGWGGSGGMEG